MTEIHKNLAVSLNEQVTNQLRLCSEIGHPGENGHSREQVIVSFLRELLPSDIGIDTGFVIDSSGAISNQIDLVIHRKGYYPIFRIGGISHFMCESVLAVVENKSRLESRTVVRSALENIRSVKALDRTGGGENTVLHDREPGSPVKEIESQASLGVFGAIVTEKSLSSETLLEELRIYCDAQPRAHWPNLYVAIHEYAGVLLHQESGYPRYTMATSRATAAAITRAEQAGNVPPLIDLAYQLSDHLRRAPTIDFQSARYFSFSTHFEMLTQLPDQPWRNP